MLIRRRSRRWFLERLFSWLDRSSPNHPRSDLSASASCCCVASPTRREVEFVPRKQIRVDIGKLLTAVPREARMRRVLLVSLVTLSISIGTSQSAIASQILYFAQQLPCFGATTPLTCFPGGVSGVAWQGPNYVSVNLPANSLIDEIDVWGFDARAAGIWDSTKAPNIPFPFTVIIPGHEVAPIAPGSIDIT